MKVGDAYRWRWRKEDEWSELRIAVTIAPLNTLPGCFNMAAEMAVMGRCDDGSLIPSRLDMGEYRVQ